MKQLAWFLVTSSNLSKAAWGAFEKKESQIFIRSYELGVLVYPQLFQKTDEQEVSFVVGNIYNMDAMKTLDEYENSGNEMNVVVPIPLPFDYPLTRYGLKDECWRSDFLQ